MRRGEFSNCDLEFPPPPHPCGPKQEIFGLFVKFVCFIHARFMYFFSPFNARVLIVFSGV
jgi:hypothetical protein